MTPPQDWPRLIAAFRDAASAASRLLRSDAVAESWSKPSVLRGYTVGGVVAHLVQATDRTRSVLEEDEPGDRRPVGLVEFYGPNRVARQPDIDSGLHAAVRAAAHRAAEQGRDAVADRFDQSRQELDALLTAAHSDRRVPVLQVSDGAATLDSYLRTRVVELVVHGDDIAQSVGLSVEMPDEAMGIALDVCLRLARATSGDVRVLRMFARQERASAEDVRVF